MLFKSDTVNSLRSLHPRSDEKSRCLVHRPFFISPISRLDKRQLTFYNILMIKSFQHKGLKLLFEEDDRRKVNAEHVDRLKLILSTLDVADIAEDMNQPTFRLHQLKGNLQSFWAVTVRANWRVIFRFADGHAYDVDLLDYH